MSPIAATILFIGGGNMARALIEGAVRASLLIPGEILVADPDESRRSCLAPLGVQVQSRAGQMAAALGDGAQVVLAVKPQSLADVARDVEGLDLTDRIVISILAGTPSERVRSAFGGRCRVVRAMPNLPASLGQGCTAVALGAGAIAGDEAFSMRLFASVGPVVERIDESLMDAFTAVAGSGPAYLFYLAEAMHRAAESFGIEPAVADRVVRQVIAGSAAMLMGSPDRSPAELRAAVTSKGGTTEAACDILTRARVMESFVLALTAARDRGRALAEGAPPT